MCRAAKILKKASFHEIKECSVVVKRYYFGIDVLTDHGFLCTGRVVRADIMTESGGRSKGCGTVLFETSEDAAHAISILFNIALHVTVAVNGQVHIETKNIEVHFC